MGMINERLPGDIEAGAKTVPMFKTTIVTTDGGREVRNSRWRYPKHRIEFNLMPGQPDVDEVIEELSAMFYAAGGALESFRFRHWRDYQGVDEEIGTGDGAETVFQLVKNYTRGTVTRTRAITRPTNGTLHIFLDGIEAGSGWSADYDTGIITFTSPPGLGVIITATFEFDIPVRFQDDEIDILAHTGEIEQAVDIILIETR